MTVMLEAPALAGSRPRAQQVTAGLDHDLAGVDVILNCRGLLAATPSFADEVLKQILVIRNAASLTVVDVTDAEFSEYLRDRAAVHDVLERLHFAS